MISGPILFHRFVSLDGAGINLTSLILNKLTRLLSTVATKAPSHKLVSLPALFVTNGHSDNCLLFSCNHLRDNSSAPKRPQLCLQCQRCLIPPFYLFFNINVRKHSCYSRRKRFCFSLTLTSLSFYKGLLSLFRKPPKHQPVAIG